MPNEDYYYKATHKDSAEVWDKFDKQESSYTSSHSYADEKDAKKTNINKVLNKNENIEDRYFGESGQTYSQDEKYYKGTSFSPSDGSFKNNQYNDDTPDNYLYFIIGGFALYLLTK